MERRTYSESERPATTSRGSGAGEQRLALRNDNHHGDGYYDQDSYSELPISHGASRGGGGEQRLALRNNDGDGDDYQHVSSSVNLVVYDEATSSFYDESYLEEDDYRLDGDSRLSGDSRSSNSRSRMDYDDDEETSRSRLDYIGEHSVYTKDNERSYDDDGDHDEATNSFYDDYYGEEESRSRLGGESQSRLTSVYDDDGTYYTEDQTNYTRDQTNYTEDQTNYTEDRTNSNYTEDQTNYTEDRTNYTEDRTNYTEDQTTKDGGVDSLADSPGTTSDNVRGDYSMASRSQYEPHYGSYYSEDRRSGSYNQEGNTERSTVEWGESYREEGTSYRSSVGEDEEGYDYYPPEKNDDPPQCTSPRSQDPPSVSPSYNQQPNSYNQKPSRGSSNKSKGSGGNKSKGSGSGSRSKGSHSSGSSSSRRRRRQRDPSISGETPSGKSIPRGSTISVANGESPPPERSLVVRSSTPNKSRGALVPPTLESALSGGGGESTAVASVAISTMSASAITMDSHSSAPSEWSSKKSYRSKGDGNGNGNGKSRDREGYSATNASSDVKRQVIPLQVKFPKKEEETGGVFGNIIKPKEDLNYSQTTPSVAYEDYNNNNNNNNKSFVADNNEHNASYEEEMSYNDKIPKPKKQWDSWKRGDDPSAVGSTIKPRNPLRNPDAARSRHTMSGRGKSSKSVAASTKKSQRQRSRSKEQPRRNRSRSRGEEAKRDKFGREVRRDERSRSRDIKRGREERPEERKRGGENNREKSREQHTEGRRKRSSSRGRSSRNLKSPERRDRDYDDRRRRERGRRPPPRSQYRGDASYAFSTPGGGASVAHSIKSNGSWRDIRHDIDAEGFCMHHPDVRLMKLRRDGHWRVMRKKCPECIMEDCPSMMGYDDDDDDDDDRSVYSNDHRRSGRGRNRSRKDSPRSPGESSYSVSDHDDSSSSSRSGSSSLSAFHDLSMAFQTPEEMEEEEATNRLKRRLAARAYHFPGNTWSQDWMQYLSNTHTVLGIFFHHPLHPMGFQERIVILFGSIAIGLTISNFTYLYFIRDGVANAEKELFTLNSHHTEFTGIPEVSITTLMITLWTLGSFVHTCFDLGLWHMKACTICRYQGRIDEQLVQWGRVLGLFIVLIAMGVGSYAVLLRASIEYKGEGSVAGEVEESIMNNELYDVEFEDKKSFRFLLGYLVEFVLALFVYYPIAVTVLFSGILGCGGRVPILGGRPREMKRELRYEISKRQPKILKAGNIDGTGGNVGDATCASTIFRDDESRSRFDENEII